MNSPKHLMVTTNTLCNYGCMFCNNPKIEHKTYVTVDRLIELVDLIEAVEIVDITGYGEIMLHPKFCNIANLLTEKQKPFTFSTNGSHLTDAMIDFLDTTTLSLMNISVNSLDPTTYRIITGGHSLDILLDNLASLFSKERKYKVTLSVVVTAYAINELMDLVQFAADNGAYRLRFLPLTSSIKDYPNEIVLKDTYETRMKLKDAEDYAKLIGVSLQTFSFEPSAEVKEKKHKCSAPTHQIIINHNGNVTPCCWLGHVIMGNLEKNTWREIWESEKYDDLRRSVHDGDLKYCKDCREFG